MVADQESARPLLDAAEICKLPATDAIVLVAGFPPFRAKRIRYYEDPLLAARAGLPTLKLKAGGPYPFRPRQRPNPWAQAINGTEAPATNGKRSAVPVTNGTVIDLALEHGSTALPDEADMEIQMQRQRDAEEHSQNLARGFDEQERVMRRHQGQHRHIPL
jgi:hypothetical protein